MCMKEYGVTEERCVLSLIMNRIFHFFYKKKEVKKKKQYLTFVLCEESF